MIEGDWLTELRLAENFANAMLGWGGSSRSACGLTLPERVRGGKANAL